MSLFLNLIHITKIFYNEVRFTQPHYYPMENLQIFSQVAESHAYTLVFRFYLRIVNFFFFWIFWHCLFCCISNKSWITSRNDRLQNHFLFSFSTYPVRHNICSIENMFVFFKLQYPYNVMYIILLRKRNTHGYHNLVVVL